MTLRNALGGKNVITYLVLGATRTTFPFGGGCDLLVQPDILISIGVGGTSGPGKGTASARLALPSDPRLKGAKAHFQWGVVDPAAKGIGVAMSNAATLTL